MQEKFEFAELSSDVLNETAQYVSTADLINFALTSKKHWTLFKPMLQGVRKFLHQVTRGEHETVVQMLKQDITLIFKKGQVTDCSARTFDNVSGFEYALWALDKHMWAAMITCIPPKEEGKKVFAKLLAQYNKVNTDGVTYRHNGSEITEKHFDFENTIIKELQTQVDSINALGAKNWDAIDKQWREGVGGAQNLLPMHVVDEYCSNEPFYHVPNFTSPPKSSRQFYNWFTEKDESWFSADSKLAIDFAIYKGGTAAAHAGWGLSVVGRAACDDELARADAVALGGPRDLNALAALYKIRTNDFINLKSQLEKQASLDNHHQSCFDVTKLIACR
jgi:hypothetical protein